MRNSPHVQIGPYDPDGDTPYWKRFDGAVRGVIPVRWIVTKDVPYSTFDDLLYNNQKVTQLRHANTIPGTIGRLTLQRYFEAPHTQTLSSHPEFRRAPNPEDFHPGVPLPRFSSPLPYTPAHVRWQQASASQVVAFLCLICWIHVCDVEKPFCGLSYF